MREWSVEDLNRWGQQIRDNELSYQNQLEIVQYTRDMMEVVNAAELEVQRLRSLWLLTYTPVTQLIRLCRAHGEGVVGDAELVGAVKFWMSGIEGELNGDQN